MRKKLLCLCLIAALCLPFCAAAGADNTEPKEITLIITSDVHFSLLSNASIYPLMSRIEDLMNTIADQVIALHPDAFILCGDNTNSGRECDTAALTAILKRIHDAGIPVIAVTGNHDFDLSGRDGYEAAYAGLCEIEERDPASLSFMAHIGPIRVLAMDDNSASRGERGYFLDETMDWLEEQLKAAKSQGETVLFISHHNVLPGGDAAEDSNYMIQNTGLRDLLLDYNVRLCLSGHRHSQEIMSFDGLYEIISAMPAISPHLIGRITIDAGRLSYRAEPINFTEYGVPYGLQAMAEQEGTDAGSYRLLAQGLAGWERYSEDERKEISRLFQTFMEGYGSGGLAEVRDEILSNPCYEAFMELFAPTNYGPWIRYMLETTLLPGNKLELDYFQ